MGDLEIGKDGEVVGDIKPGRAFKTGIGLIEAWILIIYGGLCIQFEINPVPFPQRMRT